MPRTTTPKRDFYKPEIKHYLADPTVKNGTFKQLIEAKVLKGTHAVKDKPIAIKVGARIIKSGTTGPNGSFDCEYKDVIEAKEKSVTIRIIVSLDPEELEKTFTIKVPGTDTVAADDESLPDLHIKRRGCEGKYIFDFFVTPKQQVDIVIEEGEEVKQTLGTAPDGSIDGYEAAPFKEEKRRFTFTLLAKDGKPTHKQTSICLNGPSRSPKPEPVTFAEMNAKVKRGRKESEGSYLKRFFKQTKKTVKEREKIV